MTSPKNVDLLVPHTPNLVIGLDGFLTHVVLELLHLWLEVILGNLLLRVTQIIGLGGICKSKINQSKVRMTLKY